MSAFRFVLPLTAALLFTGCAPKNPAEVSRNDLTAMRQSHAAAKVGDPKQKVLDLYKKGNTVKLGASAFDGVNIEEWKVEAFNEDGKRKDLFVSFLYFCNDRFVDSSDSRIDYRNNHELVDRWKKAVAK